MHSRQPEAVRQLTAGRRQCKGLADAQLPHSLIQWLSMAGSRWEHMIAEVQLAYLGLTSRNSSESKRSTATTVGQTRCKLSMAVVGPDLQRQHVAQVPCSIGACTADSKPVRLKASGQPSQLPWGSCNPRLNPLRLQPAGRMRGWTLQDGACHSKVAASAPTCATQVHHELKGASIRKQPSWLCLQAFKHAAQTCNKTCSTDMPPAHAKTPNSSGRYSCESGSLWVATSPLLLSASW